MRMDPQDLEDLGDAINMSRPEDPPIPEQPLVASRTSLGRFPVSAADRAAANGASSSSAPAEQPIDNQQEALLQGMVGTPEEHIMALRMATTQMLQESTPERVEEIANIFRRRPLITDPRVAAIARHGYPKPEMPLNGPLPREHYGEPPRTQEEAHNIGIAVTARVREEMRRSRSRTRTASPDSPFHHTDSPAG